MNVTGVGRSAMPESTAGSRNERLWEATHALEGVFFSQLLRAMRATVPEGEGVFTASTGEDLFSSMLDEVLGRVAAERLRGGLGDALYRELSRRIDGTTS